MFNRKQIRVPQQQPPSWATQLLQALEIDPVAIDTETLQTICENIVDESGQEQLLVGFIAGYAAGLAEGSGMAPFDRAHRASVRFMHQHTATE